MGHEVYVRFAEPEWLRTHAPAFSKLLASLPTFVRRTGDEIWLAGTDSRAPDAWSYDVRVFLEQDRVLVEISAHPPSIDRDLRALLAWLRERTTIAVVDEDGIPSDW
jgi:hypothetical protein